jgi:hypothetical protein
MKVEKKLQWQRPLVIVVLGLVGASLIWIFINVVLDELRRDVPVALGATFSTKYSRELGLDPRKVFTASLDELGVKRFRIPVYWDEVEPQPDEFQFEEIDWLIDAATQREAELIPAIGIRVPRWPECHAPKWAQNLSKEDRERHTLDFIRAVVTRYRANPTIIAWQVENEPLLTTFGECPEPDREFLKSEVALVRELDNRPIIITESGEFSSWLRTVGISDILGISMYRVSWNRFLGYIYYPLSPGFYRYRADAVRPLTSNVIVTELQAEPWAPDGILGTPHKEQYRSMDPTRLKENISFVARAGFREAHLWGIEWWYWLRETRHEARMWELGKELYAASAKHLPLQQK